MGRQARDVIWVGVDVGKSHHHACAVDAAGKVVFSRKLANGQNEIEALVARAAQAASRVNWSVDMTSSAAGLLLTVLAIHGFEITYVPGRLVNRMSGAYPGEAKTDAKDAHTIAQTGRQRGDLVTIAAADPLVAELQVLTSRREDLKGDWVRGVNRLRDLLASIFPALERAFDYSNRSPLILLTGYQTPQAIRDTAPAELDGFLREHNAWAKGIPAMVDKALTAAGEQTITLPAESVTAPLIARLARQLLDLHRELSDLDKQTKDLFSQHPHADRITSVAGFGPILGAELIATTGGDLRKAFGNPGRLAAYAGLAPVPRDSGRVQGNLHRPKRYHRGLRRVFYMAALSSVKPDGPSRAFYQRKRAEGKRHAQALIALARRLVDVIWALLRDGRQFENSPPAITTTA